MLPRRRRLPARYEDGDAPAEFDETPESRYRRVYFEALDKLTMSITDRFGQHDYNIYMNCEGLLLKTANGEDATSEFDTVTEFYGSNFMPATLQGHLQTFGSNFRGDNSSHNGATLSEIVSYIQSRPPSGKGCVTQLYAPPPPHTFLSGSTPLAAPITNTFLRACARHRTQHRTTQPDVSVWYMPQGSYIEPVWSCVRHLQHMASHHMHAHVINHLRTAPQHLLALYIMQNRSTNKQPP